MNVLQLISSRGHYGAENMVLHLCVSLRSLGCQVTAGIFENSLAPHLEVAERIRSRGIPVELIRCRGRFDWGALRTIRNCLDARKIDVLHTHGYKSNCYGYAANSADRPLIATCHNWPGTTTPLRLYYRLDRLLLRRFDKVVAVSQKVSDSLRRARIAPEKISIIRNGVDVSSFPSGSEAYKADSGGGGKMRIGVVGRLVPEKGLRYFLLAAREIVETHPNTEVVVAGDGPQRPELESLVRDLGIAKQVIFLGVVDDMPRIYSSLDMVVMPSLDEGLPLVLLEALAAGKPVVATKVGGIPGLIIEGRTGLLVEPKDARALRDAVLRLMSDEALRKRISEDGKKMVRQEYSAHIMARNYLNAYCELLRGRVVGNQLSSLPSSPPRVC